jgi:hypothetical protein
LCYAIKYLDANFGEDSIRDYLEQVAKTCFAPLTQKLELEGLTALEKHWQDIFSKEGGKFNIDYKDNKLILEVIECPAISHLKKIGQLCSDRYCETTVVVNRTICDQAGYKCSCEYEPGQGKCVQKFWKEG